MERTESTSSQAQVKQDEPRFVNKKSTDCDDSKKKEMGEKYENRLKLNSSNIGHLWRILSPVIIVFQSSFNVIAPIIENSLLYGLKVYNLIPFEIFYALFGLVLTFFGGVYVLTLAAWETFYLTGWDTTKSSLLSIIKEFKQIWAESSEDHKKDEDKDDSCQKSSDQILLWKVGLFFSKCKDPQKILEWIGAIGTSILGVIAVLKVDFLMSVSLGAMIGENLRKPATYFVLPAIIKIVPEKYHQWISPTLNIVCKTIGITLACYLKRIISSVQSAIRGGLIISSRIVKYLQNHGYIQLNEMESNLEAGLGWIVAACGIMFQLSYLFSLAFPLNIFMFPVTLFENYLQSIVIKE